MNHIRTDCFRRIAICMIVPRRRVKEFTKFLIMIFNVISGTSGRVPVTSIGNIVLQYSIAPLAR